MFECVPNNEAQTNQRKLIGMTLRWHSVTREHLIRTGGNSDSYDPKWERFLPFQRFNLGRSSISFVIDSKKTYEIIEPGDRYQKTWVSQPSSGLDERQCTLQVCTRGDGLQPNIAFELQVNVYILVKKQHIILTLMSTGQAVLGAMLCDLGQLHTNRFGERY